MRAVLAFAVAALSAMTLPVEACSGCGCRGGPGYRGPNGQCVSWKAFARTCGSPPTAHCSAEHVNAKPGGEDNRPSPKKTPRRAPQIETRPNPF